MDPLALSPGVVLAGRYEITREIGRGGYSIVYQARDRRVGSDVAVKLLVPPPVVAHLARERMRREVQAVRELSHEHIVAVYDLIEEETRACIVMEYVAGPDLQARVLSGGALTVPQLESVGKGIASALAAAHRHGILHRDVKPQNILLAPDGRARLTDFGSARVDGQASVTQTGGLVGTLAYTAPEVLAGQRGDARADVFSLGMTLYFAATGALPPGTSLHLPPPAAPEGHRARASRRDIPEWLDGIIARATAADPRDRFPAASVLLTAIEDRSAQSLPARKRGQEVDVASESCVMCGGLDEVGIGLCTQCRTAPTSSDALIFVRPTAGSFERESARTVLTSLLKDSSEGDLRAALGGERPLARVPADATEAVVERLVRRGVPVRSVPLARTWTVVPLPMWVLLGLVIGFGLTAGMVEPVFSVTSPVVAALMATLALSTARRPLLSLRERRWALPSGVADDVRATLRALPPGPARSLLTDVTRLAESVVSTVPSSEGRQREEVLELLRACCEAARDLAHLDESLKVLEAQRDRPDRSARWMDVLARCTRSRDRLVQRMLDAITVLGDASTQAAGSRGAELRLAEMTDELARTARAESEAAKEVEAILAAGTARAG
ncbi:MAG TPA: serine/threonine-protein kinase [Gemmatimonadaceae bacterium]|nr:serine/threonine-protein kinase [Gemmatimonadaceae bacterium]